MTLFLLPTSRVRCDRIASPYWRALTDDERAAIEAAIPDGHHLTALARTGSRDYTVRLLRETGPGMAVLVQAVRGRNLAATMRAALGLA